MKHGRSLVIAGLGWVAMAVALAWNAHGGQDSLAAPTAMIIYVDADAVEGGGGTSWADAYNDLQFALAAAGPGVEIWVTEGIYEPTDGSDRTMSFELKNDVAVYGGFAGTEDSRDQRDWETYVTVLSGDIDGNDTTDPYGVITDTANITGINSYHVIYSSSATETAVLDGFTVTGGNATGGEWPNNRGGGMFNYASSPTLTNCTFSGNLSHSGGGIANRLSSPTVTNCFFSGNSGDYGGGMNNNDSSPTLTNCTFERNRSFAGGGMSNYASSPTLTNCTFEGNYASEEWGGGMYNLANSSPNLTNCTFEDNHAPFGGGMCNKSSSPTLTNCTFEGNRASQGAGMYNEKTSYSPVSPKLTNCTMKGNLAHDGGGGMYNISSSPILTNCTFEGNRASSGAGMHNTSDFYLPGSPTLINCTFWDNTPDQIANPGPTPSAPAIYYSDVQGSFEDDVWDSNLGTDGGGNIDADPLFVDATSGDLHLGPGSPCIDTGTNAAPNLSVFDFEGDPRIMDGDGDGMATVDMGVDEAFGFRAYLPLTLKGH